MKNHAKYVDIRDEQSKDITENTKEHIDNRLILLEAKNMLQQLDVISEALNAFQASKKINLANTFI